ncbi:MAG: 2-keto-4-pentenoate hydratase [Paracoccaceae bacterium]|jgi:2-keto-4-pentenoate hydratase
MGERAQGGKRFRSVARSRRALARARARRHDVAMTPDAIAATAEILANLRLRAPGTAPMAGLPPALRPATMADAAQVQARLRGVLAARGLGAPAGWKIGCAAPVMQAFLGIDHPCAGTLYAGGLHHGHARLEAARFYKLGLECEIAVRLGADLPHGRDPAQVRAAVGAAMTSIELVEERFTGLASAGAPTLAADDFFSIGCVLGEARALDDLPDLGTLEGGFEVDGAAPEHTGTGAAIMGHPLLALAWLADAKAAEGACLRAGEVITLGSIVRTIYPAPGMRVVARIEGLGSASVEVV